MPGIQKKTAQSYINNKVNYWAWSLNDHSILKGLIDLSTDDKDKLTSEDKDKIKQFHDKLIDNVLVSGGCIASMLLGDEVNDIDMYFIDKEVAKLVAQYYLNTMLANDKLKLNWAACKTQIMDNATNGVMIYIKSQGVAGEDVGVERDYTYFELHDDQNEIEKFFGDYSKTGATKKSDSPKHTVSFMTSNAISLANGVQLIFRFCGDAAEIHRNFDFAHCTNFWTKGTGLVYNPAALQALLEKRLVYNGSLFPVAAMFRLRKFIGRGYRVSAGELTKIAYDISRLDLNNPVVLRDQLMGCDIAYFMEVIRLLREGQTENKSIDRTYLFSIIERVFNDHDVEGDVNDGG